MSHLVAVYTGFALLSLPLFARLPARTAIAIVYLTGLVYLPPLAYPQVEPDVFPWWIIGPALPSDLMLGRAWAAPLVALIGGLAVDHDAWRRYRPGLCDLAMLGWCVWPLVQGAIAPGATSPVGWRSTLYLMGVWGSAWLLGRVHFATREDGWLLLRIFCYVTLPLIPFALWEALTGPSLHDALIGHHPFRDDGALRYIGYRPLLLFENGNQYGIWICCAALAAAAVAREEWSRGQARDRRNGDRWIAIAFVLGLMAIAAQSIGALALLGFALASLFSRRVRRWLRFALAPLLLGGTLLAGIHVSGAVPVRSMVENTAAGQALLDTVRATGRGSIAWRVSQDLKVLPLVERAPVMGSGRWDWWRPAGTRPWGAPMLILGQFGLVGILLAAAVLCGPAIGALANRHRSSRTGPLGQAMILLIAMAVADGFLNSFIFLPAIALAGALASRQTETQMTRGKRRPNPVVQEE